MARYIDADKFIKQFERALEHQQKHGLYNHAKLTECVIKAIENEPTADVVPRAELSKAIENFIAAQDKVISEAKAEVAREIFEEIENLFGDATEVTILATIIETENYKQLKKKYTE